MCEFLAVVPTDDGAALASACNRFLDRPAAMHMPDPRGERDAASPTVVVLRALESSRQRSDQATGIMIADALGAGRYDAETSTPHTMKETTMSDLDAKREEIAVHVARALGFDGLARLSPADRAVVDQQTAKAINECDPTLPIPADCSDTDREMWRLLSEYHAGQQLRADNSNVRLAEEGEVFAPEDDA